MTTLIAAVTAVIYIILSSGFYPKNRIPVGGARFVDFTWLYALF